ncbi:MAG: hypothetical protein CVV61_04745 [Tenericutes bacterium HGW-Tenericutes-6]|nr:MAG: hypothetical protein CVV61_04745 [Tenericutes bacterium HGW-Tenericutes-6]
MQEAIMKRKSVRTYEKRKLSEPDLECVKKILEKTNTMKGPFANQMTFFYYDPNGDFDDEGKMIGTYGFVKNPPAFFGAATKNDMHHLIDFGYLFERIVLKLTKIGLGTVWLGGTFHRQALKHLLHGMDIIPAISPVGYPEDKTTFRDKAIRFSIKADRRKDFSEMYYLEDFKQPLIETYEEKIPYLSSLIFLQKAPSASNKQPWRVLIQKNVIHLYLEKTPNYATSLPFPIQYLDMGIALFHIEEGLKFDQKTYEMKMTNHPQYLDWIYILSFEIKD